MVAPSTRPLAFALASDHAALELRQKLGAVLRTAGCTVLDLGTDGPASVDYPAFAQRLCQAILAGQADRGVLVCGTGIGMSIAANRHQGIRAALCTSAYMARMARRHNDANVLCLGARVIGVGEAEDITRAFLAEPFEGGRHQKRLDQIDAPC